MKLCLVSTSVNQITGYSKVASHILSELVRGGVDVVHYAHGKLPVPVRESAEVDTLNNETFSFTGLKNFCEDKAVDVVLIYNDIGVICEYLRHWTPPRLWAYLDVVAEGVPPVLLKHLADRAEKIFMMSEYWRSVYSFPQAIVMEHGVDTGVIKRLPAKDNETLRAKLGIPAAARVFLNVNRNSKRKRLDLTVSAFVQYAQRNPEPVPYLVLITDTKDGFYDIQSVLHHEIRKHNFNCSAQVLSVNTGAITLDDKHLNQFMNIADVGLNTSTGEGFGLTALEFAALGIPQALTGTYAFLDATCASFVPPLPDREYYEMTEYSGAFQGTYASLDIVKAMEEAVQLPPFEFKPNSWSTALRPLRECCNVSTSRP